MEDDDEFGDLYTDVLRPLTASFQSHSQGTDAAAAATNAAPSSSESRPIDLKINSDDEEILYGAPDSKNSNSSRCFNLNALVQEKPLHVPGGRPEQMVFNLNIGSNFEADSVESLGGNGGRRLDSQARVLEKVNFIEDEDDINIVVEERDDDDGLVEKDNNLIVDNNHDMYNSAAEKENTFNFVNESEVRPEQMIPGVSGRLENHGGSNFEEDWESEESEDDLQIVLNDNNHGAMGIERMPGFDGEDEEDVEQLVIVADNGDGGHHHHQPVMMEEQDWGGEEGGPGAGGERKELGDSNKTTAGAGSAAQAAVQPKIGYTNHAYQHPLHSQFKYVRPGAAPIPGAASVTPGGIPGQVRPPITMGPVAGRGRGDWRPGGIRGSTPIQKGFILGYGVPVWGVNSAGRGYGSGLDFTLPSHKTIFEVDIDSFEDKPWKLPGIEISDFFNFGLNEDSWKDYCKQLELLRLEKTMQSKIRVYESGRAEQEYDRDLPPELAAAVSVQDIPFESANPGKVDSCSTEVARASANGRTPLPVGRPIPVEFGSGDRPPSVDSRRQRMHDIDAIIEVVCHNPMDDDDITEQQDNDPAGNDLGGGDEIDDLPQDDTEHVDRNSHVYNGRKRELDARRTQFEGSIKRESEDVLHFHPEVPVHHKPDGEIGITHEARLKKGRGRVNSPNMTANDNKREIMSHQNEESFTVGNGTQSPLSSSRAIGSDGEQNVSVRDDTNDESVIDDISFDEEREDKAVDETCMDTLEDGNLMDSTKNQKLSSRLEQLSQEDDDMEDSKAASSDNSKARSGSSKDHRKLRDSVEDEILQYGRPRSAGNSKRPVEDEDNASRKVPRGREEIGRHHKSVKGRENSYPRRGEDHNSSLRRLVKSESADWRKESDISEGSWHRRGEDHHGRRIRVEDTRKMEHGGEFGSRNWGKLREGERSEKEHHQSRNQLDNGSWSAVNHKKNLGSRQRDWDDNHKSRNSKVDDLQSKKRKEEAYISREHAAKDGISHNHRESSSQRKGVRDDDSEMILFIMSSKKKMGCFKGRGMIVRESVMNGGLNKPMKKFYQGGKKKTHNQ
ncbi:hypothetical protein ACJIZ3_025279 [Penstemon smallii]|uniref:Pre-mRNA polyadenylation factor Fip1 domain-containing protein n=1 Tax=Penstemon smallii TaxID=265156 RepID=A0ABD3TWQ3_9LAMI